MRRLLLLKKTINSFSLIFALIFTLNVSSLWSQYLELPKEAAAELKVADVQKYVQFLASDALEGRHTLAQGGQVAAQYIQGLFNSWGLQPFEGKSFQVPFYFSEERLSDQQELFLAMTGEEIYGSYMTDYFIQYERNASRKLNLPLHFCGYGLLNDKLGWNDYKGISLKNSAAVVLDDLPDFVDENGKSAFGKRRGKYCNPLNKVKGAMAAGAKLMVVIVPDKQFHSKLMRYKKSVSRTVRYTNAQINSRIPIVFVNEVLAQHIFKGKYRNIKAIQQEILQKHRRVNFAVKNVRLSLKINFEQQTRKGVNVIALKEGVDPRLKNEYVVVSAHYDHIGIVDGKINNGADDNASGTSGMLELAEMFARHLPTKRSMLFIGFGGEELGLLGSHYFVRNFSKNPEDIAACVNLDMIGRGEKGKIKIIGMGYSTDLKNINQKYNEEIGFDLTYKDMFFTSRSDQWPFLKNKIPAIFYFAGFHDDYHTPKDDSEKINYEKLIKITKLAGKVAYHLAMVPKKPKWHEKKVVKK